MPAEVDALDQRAAKDDGAEGAGPKKVGDMSIDELAAALAQTKIFAPVLEVSNMLMEEEAAGAGGGGEVGLPPEGAEPPGGPGGMAGGPGDFGPPPQGGPPGMAPGAGGPAGGMPPDMEARGLHEPPPLRYSGAEAGPYSGHVPSGHEFGQHPAHERYARNGHTGYPEGTAVSGTQQNDVVVRLSRELAARDQEAAKEKAVREKLEKRLAEVEVKQQANETLLKYAKRRRQLEEKRAELLLDLDDNDISEELDDTKDFDDARFEKHMTNRVCRKYSRLGPVEPPFQPGPGGGVVPQLSKQEMERVCNYASSKGITDIDAAISAYRTAAGQGN